MEALSHFPYFPWYWQINHNPFGFSEPRQIPNGVLIGLYRNEEKWDSRPSLTLKENKKKALSSPYSPLRSKMKGGETGTQCQWVISFWQMSRSEMESLSSLCSCHIWSKQTNPFHQKGSERCLKITEKVSFTITSEASYAYILNGQKLIKNAKNGRFCPWSLSSNSVTSLFFILKHM